MHSDCAGLCCCVLSKESIRLMLRTEGADIGISNDLQVHLMCWSIDDQEGSQLERTPTFVDMTS